MMSGFLGSGSVNSLLNITIANALTVIPLALIAGLVTWRCGRAPLRHAIWVLVLLKFVTPPLFSLPVKLAVLPAAVAVASTDPATTAGQSYDLPAQAVRSEADLEPAAPDRDLQVGCAPAVPSSTTPISVSACPVACPPPFDWASAILTAWLSGSLLWLGLQLVRAVRFEMLVSQRSHCPEELQSQCSELAHRLGVVRAPRVCVIDAAISPMLWGMGSRAKLLFPARLAARMNEESRSTLLMHELAHYCRGDHLVRFLELVVTGLFWWHPVLWIARRQIEQSEEECCDAWVVQQFPKAPRRYAEALLDTLDFLCESRRALPPLASGLGQAPFLRRRLTQIMAGTTIPPLSLATRVALLLCAGMLLPVQPFVLRAATGNRATQALPETLVTTVRETAQPSTAELLKDPFPQIDNEPVVEPTPEQRPPSPLRRPPRPPRSRKNGEVWSTAVSPDGRFVIRVYTTRRVTMTDMEDHRVTELPTGSIAAVAFSPDGRSFVSTGSDGRVVRWSVASSDIDQVLLNQPVPLNTVAMSPEGDRIAVGGRDGLVMILNATGKSTPLQWTAPTSVNCVRFSPNGRHLAVGCGDWMASLSGQVILFDTEHGQIAHQKRTAATGAIAFASDDELILGGWAGKVQLWNLASNEIVAEGQVDKNVVSAAAFSPDNPALREAELLPMVTPSAPDSAFFFFQNLLQQVP